MEKNLDGNSTVARQTRQTIAEKKTKKSNSEM